MNYPIGDFLIRLKNAVLSKKSIVTAPKTNLVMGVAELLHKEGYVNEVSIEKGMIKTSIAYKKKEPLIMDISLVSKPGLRIYLGVDDLKLIRGPRRLLLSTPKGIMFHPEAIKKNLGGEVIAKFL